MPVATHAHRVTSDVRALSPPSAGRMRLCEAAEGRYALRSVTHCQAVGSRAGKMLTTIGSTNRSRSEEHTSELQSLMRISYAVFCLKKKKLQTKTENNTSSTR